MIREHVPLAPSTTLGIGGAARYFAEAYSEREVKDALTWARERGLETLVLGGGSNLLVADRGYNGLVLRVRMSEVVVSKDDDGIELDVDAGEVWDALVERAVASGWAGIECLSGIPGDVGAVPIQNVGAYGQEVAETIVSVRAVERVSGEIVMLDNAACSFGYRESVFKREARDRYVITRVRFRLRPGGAAAVRYAELTRKLASSPRPPSLAELRAAVIELRLAKSMIFDPSDEDGRSAGSFFMNPTLDAEALATVRARIEAAGVLRAGESIPQFAAGEGRVKLAAGWLIERAGFPKGTGEGRVGLSSKHALAIVNRGGASAAELVAFARRVQTGVREKFGVTLRPEPMLVGFEPHEIAGLLAGS